jgi:hypothetical protein
MPAMQSAKPLFSYRRFWAHRLGPAPFLPTTREEMARVLRSASERLSKLAKDLEKRK